MNVKNVWAYTAPGADYPQFISINEVTGNLIVTIRGPNRVFGEDGEFIDGGEIVAIELDAKKASSAIAALNRWLNNEGN